MFRTASLTAGAFISDISAITDTASRCQLIFKYCSLQAVFCNCLIGCRKTSGQQNLKRHPVLSLLGRLFQSIQGTISIICRLTIPLSDDKVVIIVSSVLILTENGVLSTSINVRNTNGILDPSIYMVLVCCPRYITYKINFKGKCSDYSVRPPPPLKKCENFKYRYNLFFPKSPIQDNSSILKSCSPKSTSQHLSIAFGFLLRVQFA